MHFFFPRNSKKDAEFEFTLPLRWFDLAGCVPELRSVRRLVCNFTSGHCLINVIPDTPCSSCFLCDTPIIFYFFKF